MLLLYSTLSFVPVTSALRSHLAHNSNDYRPHSPRAVDYRDRELAGCTTAASSPHFRVCKMPTCAAADATDADVPPFGSALIYPAKLVDGRATVDVVQRMLQRAWSDVDRSVDLFVRTGCHGAREVRYLFDSVELFWPRGVGRVVVVLDAADRGAAHRLIPAHTRHAYAVMYERTPCMPGRVFNQVSYLMADHYATADVLVTIDSDCMLHTPVTPGLLFAEGGRIKLPHTRTFQPALWTSMVELFTGVGTYESHTMVSQPVTFHRATLRAYRAWVAVRGRCLLDRVVDAVATVPHGQLYQFCWMCQLGTFVTATGQTADLYQMVDVDVDTDTPYQRFAVHIPHELDAPADYDSTCQRAVMQGLCWTLGVGVFGDWCGNTTYVQGRQFAYHSHEWGVTAAGKARVRAAYLTDVRRWLEDE